MISCKLDADGTLTVQAHDPIGSWALKQWENQHRSGRAKLKIEHGTLINEAEFYKHMAATIGELNALKARAKGMIFIPHERARELGIDDLPVIPALK